MIRIFGLLCLFSLCFHQSAFAQAEYIETEVTWLDNAEVLNEQQLEQATFVEQLEEDLAFRTYYYVKVKAQKDSADVFPILLCRNFIGVEYLHHNRWTSINELGWTPRAMPLALELPDSLSQKSYFYLRCYNYSSSPPEITYFYWVSSNYFDNRFNKIDENDAIIDVLPNFLSTGLIIAFILFFGVLYVSNPSQKLYLYYILYLIPLAIYLFGRSEFIIFHLLPEAFAQNTYLFVFTNYPIQVIFHVSYTIFTFTFLNAKEDYPLYYKVGRLTILFALVFSIILSIGMYIHPYSSFWKISFQVERLLVSLFSLWANFYVITKRKNRMALIIAFGSLIFLAGAWGAFFFHMNLMRLGSIIEVLFFSYGIGYKISLESKEKDEIKTKLINELKEKEILQQKYSTELEQEVKDRSEELVEKAKQVEEAKKEKLKAQLEKKLEATKMVAMRSQMNPHFLFNSLNSIRHLIIRDKTTEAYDYLSKFAVLMRAVLENAEQDAVLLNSELQVIQTYVSLEKLRFNDDFQFEVTVNNKVLSEEIYVPPLLIQPFLENAIIHGLATKKEDKILLLDININHNKVCIKIEDNGIGRKENNNQSSGKKHKSMAINIAQERLDLFANFYSLKKQFPASIKIHDKISHDGIALGTVVSLELPLVRKTA